MYLSFVVLSIGDGYRAPTMWPSDLIFNTRLLPALKGLLDTAVAAGAVRSDVDAEELLHAVENLCRVSHAKGPAYARRMVALLVDGLCYGA